MPQGPRDAPRNEPAGALPGRMRPASTLRCEELRRLAKGCPAPKQTSGQPPITHGRVPNPKKKKCSLGLQVTVEAEAGLFLAAAPQTAVAALPQEAAPGPGRAGSEAFSRSSATSSGQPAARNRQPSVRARPVEGPASAKRRPAPTAGTHRQRCLSKRATPASSTS